MSPELEGILQSNRENSECNVFVLGSGTYGLGRGDA